MLQQGILGWRFRLKGWLQRVCDRFCLQNSMGDCVEGKISFICLESKHV